MTNMMGGNAIPGGLLSAVLLLATMSVAAGTIVGSKHDLSGYLGANGQICVACHAPHNAAAGMRVLWNHALSGATYSMYDSTFSSSLNAGAVAQPSGVSKLCLSCHDGTVALNSFGGVSGSGFISGNRNLGTNLQNDHPIGFPYDAALVAADGALKPITTAVTIGGGGRTRTGTISSLMLANGSVECSSCHDVHNTFTVPVASSGTSPSNMLVKVTMLGSALCITCHDK